MNEATIAKKQIFEITGDGVTTEFRLEHVLGRFIACAGMYDEEGNGYGIMPDRLIPGIAIFKFGTALKKDKKYTILLVG